MDDVEISWTKTDLSKIPNLKNVDLSKSLKHFGLYQAYVRMLTIVYFSLIILSMGYSKGVSDVILIDLAKTPEKAIFIASIVSLILTLGFVASATHGIEKKIGPSKASVKIKDESYWAGILAYKYLPKGMDTIIAGFAGGIVLIFFIPFSIISIASSFESLMSTVLLFSYFGVAVIRSVYIIFQPLALFALLLFGFMLYLGIRIPYENQIYGLFPLLFLTVLPSIQQVLQKVLKNEE